MYCSNNICCNFFIFTFMIFSNAWLMVFLSKISRHDQRWCFIFLESFNSCKNFLSPIFCNSLSFSFFLFFLVEFIFFFFKIVFLILPHPVNLFDGPVQHFYLTLTVPGCYIYSIHMGWSLLFCHWKTGRASLLEKFANKPFVSALVTCWSYFMFWSLLKVN